MAEIKIIISGKVLMMCPNQINSSKRPRPFGFTGCFPLSLSTLKQKIQEL